MGLIARPTKEGGANTYSGKVALGFDDILAEEFDDDFGVLFGVINGSLDAQNLADLAVTTPKLANGAVTDAKVAANAGILGSKLANQTIPTSKLQIGATVNARAQLHTNPNVGFAGASEVVIAQMPIVTRGPNVEIFVCLSGYVTVIQDGQLRNLMVFLYRNAFAIASQMVEFAVPSTPAGLGTFRLPFTLPLRYSDAAAIPLASNVYAANLRASAGTGGAVNSVQINLVEHA